ncbi:putative 2-aminoethylphosphonate ABC transporter ATP-binding protein [Defluviimonas sp. WL0024]|uniref:2-aminoethylphosphonate ABC transporter ATP-binding protein n=2 Tax=Albidovulum TaxID=205889 RepID=A0ABT3J557_9RHOB|nr:MULTISPECIES: putative 2-aminoethylphosphonate ABC transporter ATP-binding protein [Defluviimonas]MCU9849046.1 putative 2-aminoethylphosphonate ABC transporter ATP-binding protein [Defluviimonas sp. WL0024]MCW3782827.1 putative 2-aminoethylphosphonate ABC transporter ATP-binding protein [Defluviimonas salinarum]
MTRRGALQASAGDHVAEGSAQPYLEIADLWKSFGDFVALREVTLDIAKGEFVCFLGPSGCGKTTLLRAIAGLDPQTRGTIRQGGSDISSLPPSQRDFGIVFQSYALFPNLTVRRNIAFGLENTGRSKREIDARVTELLDLVGLPEQASKYPAQLSGGQQQRVALARAIAIDPGLLLLDEPLSALDAKVRVHLRHQIKELQRKLGVTTIMVTHDQEEALSMADRIVVINRGRIEQVGTPTEIYREPASLFVADFIGETNKVASTYQGGSVTLGDVVLATSETRIADGAAVTVAVRPEDILPHRAEDAGNGAANMLPVTITDMEFLGSYWRTHLRSDALGETPLVANFSMNAVRRLELEPGTAMAVELPAERVLVFARGA